MKLNGSQRNCPSCGAPVTTEICPYCHVATGLDTKTADMEYPVIECREANINFFNCVFPMIFAVSFGFFGVPFPFILFQIVTSTEVGSGAFDVVFFFGVFAAIAVVALVFALKPIIRYFIVKLNGKDIESIVYGYMDDNILLNDHPAQIVKLLVDTNDGKKFILYQLADTKQPFKINSKLKLKVYKDIFLIENKKKYYFE